MTAHAQRVATAHVTVVNDVHSKLNETRVAECVLPNSTADVQRAVLRAQRTGLPIAIAGGRHAMGGQQFVADGMLIDTQSLRSVLAFDAVHGTIDVQAGMQWPELVAALEQLQRGRAQAWGIAQKQTGADRLSMGGALAANVHGRGLQMRPFIDDVESFQLVDARGQVHVCSRTQEPELFRLVIGGYGLFGVVTALKLRLARRRKVRRLVRLLEIDQVIKAFDRCIADGHLYGDFQFATDESSNDFLNRGVFSTYQPVPDDTAIPDLQLRLDSADWQRLVALAHVDKSEAFRRYARHYTATHGQVYWSDTHQMSTYLDNYHAALDQGLGADCAGSEVISELYVPRPALADFMAAAARDFRAHGVNVIYGTVRLIERDEESVLSWARARYVCVVFNLHTDHSPAGLRHTAAAFRRLIDLAIARGGSFYLTYHRHAGRAQVEACYPRFTEFLSKKLAYDPDERFQSEWYRHYVQKTD